mgnify:CR=1 FL=1
MEIKCKKCQADMSAQVIEFFEEKVTSVTCGCEAKKIKALESGFIFFE